MFKWTGSKKWLRHHLKDMDELLELFAGSAWISFSRAQTCHLNDTCVPLIRVYESLKNDKPKFLHEVRKNFSQIQSASDPRAKYYELRNQFNVRRDDPVLFCVLLHSCFNGLWRTSRNGFNVPYGGDRKLNLETLESIPVEKIASLTCNPWEEVIIPNDDCIVYADPPYAGTHTIYTSTSWHYGHNEKLLEKLSGLPNPVLITLMGSEENYKLLKKFDLKYAEKSRTFRNGPSKGKQVKELLCFNDAAYPFLDRVKYILG
tara:strand:+ start:1649 stop:2428 length:780 start_codon:yes stop_codon:yes gene_type:complete